MRHEVLSGHQENAVLLASFTVINHMCRLGVDVYICINATEPRGCDCVIDGAYRLNRMRKRLPDLMILEFLIPI
jgi:hypothetical protein